MLEWSCSSFVTGMIGVGTLFIILVVSLIIRDGGFGWVVHWYLWVIVLTTPLLALLANKNVRMSAGADWFMHGSSFVKTYELTSVRVSIGGAAHMLSLVDQDKREVFISLLDIQGNPRLWDLVYNGILHSIYHNNATVNKRAAASLVLDLPNSRTAND